VINHIRVHSDHPLGFALFKPGLQNFNFVHFFSSLKFSTFLLKSWDGLESSVKYDFLCGLNRGPFFSFSLLVLEVRDKPINIPSVCEHRWRKVVHVFSHVIIHTKQVHQMGDCSHAEHHMPNLTVEQCGKESFRHARVPQAGLVLVYSISNCSLRHYLVVLLSMAFSSG
jgi:hypothetical protein